MERVVERVVEVEEEEREAEVVEVEEVEVKVGVREWRTKTVCPGWMIKEEVGCVPVPSKRLRTHLCVSTLACLTTLLFSVQCTLGTPYKDRDRD